MNEAENIFVQSVFRREFRDRLCYELGNAKKRSRFFDKIAHNSGDYISSAAICSVSDMPHSRDEVISFINAEKVRVIAAFSALDKSCTELSAAVSELLGNGMPFIIFNNSVGRAYLETEYDFSVHTSYLLKY